MRSFITATRVTQRLCSPSRDGQELLPQLVAKLITASVPKEAIREFRFPHGDQIYLPGEDGILVIDDAIQRLYVPSGISVWEMSTDMDPKSKADEDFSKAEKKLSNAFPNTAPSITSDNATFVFVTPKSWESSKWVKEKRAGSAWKSIKVLDAVSLENWLERWPTVMLWFADVCGVPAEGLYDAEQYLSKLGANFGTALSPELAIAGREDKLKELGTIIQSNKELHIRGESVEEAAALLAASSLQEIDAFSKVHPLVFADSRANLNLIATHNTEITLVPLDSEALAKAKGIGGTKWRLVIPEVASLSPSDLTLGQCKRPAIEQHLTEHMKFPEHRAKQIARDCKGSLVALLWLIGSGPTGVPHWASRKDATTHASLMLAGSWIGSNTSDTAIIERLSQKDYRGIETLLQSALVPEGPWIHQGVEWLCASREFVWTQLASKITETMLRDFCDVVHEVVGEQDPSLDLPMSQRYMANILGKTRKHSSSLRKGLMDSVVRLAVVRTDGQSWADHIVHDLLDPKHPEAPIRWLSLVDVYSELAEAAPKVFLDCLDSMLQQNAMSLFQDDGDADTFFGPTSPHVYLLWALERLAWQKDCFSQVLGLLAKLAEVDPGGKTLNRPKTSLITILLPWSPQHGESMEKAAKALDMLYQASPDVAWDVARGLLPTSWSSTTPTPTPEYRPHVGERKVTVQEYQEFILGVVERMTNWVGNNPVRLAGLAEAYPELRKDSPEAGDLVTNALNKTDTSKLADVDKAVVYEALRKPIAHHRAHKDSEWALPQSDIQALEDLQKRFTPSDAVLQHKCLFSWDHDIPDAPMRPYDDGWDEWLGGKRAKAAKAVYDQKGLAGIFRLAEEVMLPGCVGQAVAAIDLPKDEMATLLRKTLSNDPGQYANNPLMNMGRGYVWSKYRESGEAWFEALLQQPEVACPPKLRANLALSIPPRPELWKRLQKWGDETNLLYWKNVDIIRNVQKHWSVILDKWKAVLRPWSSLELISDLVDERHQDQAIEKPSADRVMDILEQALQADESVEPFLRRGQMLTYYIERIFIYLDSQNVDITRLAQLEWGWLSVLKNTKRGVTALQQQVTSSPDLFVKLLKVLFRAEGEQPSEAVSDNQRRQVEQASRLLREIHTVPGMRSTNVGEVVDGEILRSWVLKARELAKDAKRLRVCDSQIGQILSYSPQSPDGTWPCEEVRNIIEDFQSSHIENGLRIGKLNQRGVISRGKGGKQEWDLAKNYRALADQVRTRWPRTAGILDSLAKGYEREAREWDKQTEWEEYE